MQKRQKKKKKKKAQTSKKNHKNVNLDDKNSQLSGKKSQKCKFKW